MIMQLNSTSGRFFSKLVVVFSIVVLIASCSTNTEIRIDSIESSENIGVHFEPVQSQKMNSATEYNLANPDGFWAIKLVADKDLTVVVEKKEMAFLYYDLTFCDVNSENAELFSNAVFISKERTKVEDRVHSYFVFLPKNYMSRIKNYLIMQNKNIVDLDGKSDLCISLGAGSMAGQRLKSNRVKLNQFSFLPSTEH